MTADPQTVPAQAQDQARDHAQDERDPHRGAEAEAEAGERRLGGRLAPAVRSRRGRAMTRRRAGGNGGAMAEALRRAGLVDQVRADRSG